MAAAAKYAHEDDGAEAERPLKVCAEAGRKCVRSIHQYPILSVEWIALIDSLKQLTRLVQLESRMPANPKVAEIHGRDRESEGTLWDQESHENAIRILVEEAKVNLCLRMMNDFKAWQYDDRERAATIAQVKENMEYSDVQIETKCQHFEESLGLLLWRAFVHVETLQLMDIPLLIEHCALVFSKSRGGWPVGAGAKSQETVVLYYFSSLMKHAEMLNNGELLAKCRELRLIHLATEHLLNPAEEADGALLGACAEGFAALADNEDFACDWPSYFEAEVDVTGNVIKTPEEVMNIFLSLDEVVLQPVLKDYPERRRVLRPLMDLFNKIRRGR